MKRLLYVLALGGVVASVTIFAGSAVAAEPMAPAYSWTGFYLGGTVGYSWGTADNTLSVIQTDTGNPPVSFGANDSAEVRGIIGGIEGGYNWQVGSFLLGIETDFEASSQSGTNTFNGSFPVSVMGVMGTQIQLVNGTDTSKLRWLGTTRGRIGYANDRWLVFASGGVAYGEVNLSGIAQAPLNPVYFGVNAPITWNQPQTNIGWTVGAGAEYAIASNLTWKLEYLYVDLGNFTANVSGGIGDLPGPAAAGNCYGSSVGCGFYRNPASGTVTSHFTDNILRFGMNYKF